MLEWGCGGVTGRSVRPWHSVRRNATIGAQALRTTGSRGIPADPDAEMMGWDGAGDGNRTHDIQLGKLTFYL